VLRRCVWSRNLKNRCSIYIYDISNLRVSIKIRFYYILRYKTQCVCVCFHVLWYLLSLNSYN
jgi:hypothetical protein